MLTQKTKNNYICVICHYYSNKKTDYNKHIHTNKHIVNKNGDLVNTKNDNYQESPYGYKYSAVKYNFKMKKAKGIRKPVKYLFVK